jgi:glycine dehydrogenase subunit 1
MATVFLSTLGKEGFGELARMNLSKAEYAKKVVSQVRGFRIAFSSPTFNEFVLEVPGDPERVLGALKQERIIGGLLLARPYPELEHHLLVTVTEMITKEEIDCWAKALRGIAG